MVTLYGMTDNLGPVTYQPAPSPFLQQQALFSPKEISDQTARQIDEEVRRIVTEGWEEARRGLERLAQESQGHLHQPQAALHDRQRADQQNHRRLPA